MPHSVLLKKITIRNFGPIVEDTVHFDRFTYFVGRNNAGKSHYLRAVELLLAQKNPVADEIFKLQHDKSREVFIEGEFEGVQHFTPLLKASKHEKPIQEAIVGGTLRVVRILSSSEEVESVFGIYNSKNEIVNPSGFTQNLLRVLPEPISIIATADTTDELKSKGNTAIMKLKREVLGGFLEKLKTKTIAAFGEVGNFLNSQVAGERAAELIEFENNLKDELAGEFAEVQPSIEFGLPDEEVIAQDMKLLLDDGHKSEVEQKGHGLQRATLLALLRLLAKQGARYLERPAPLFLVGELETFLHPYAQRQLAHALSSLVDRYQIVTTTHSPFIITPENIEGYRRVRKEGAGSKNLKPDWAGLDVEPVKRHLEWRGNLEGLFADRLVLVEGGHDENFYEKLRTIFNVPFPPRDFTLFVKTSGKGQLRVVRNFYLRMGFAQVRVIADLDYLFGADITHLARELNLDPTNLDGFRRHIGWASPKNPSLGEVLIGIEKNGYPNNFEDFLSALEKHQIFVLRHGAPEHYYKNDLGRKDGWSNVQAESDLLHAGYLKTLMQNLLA